MKATAQTLRKQRMEASALTPQTVMTIRDAAAFLHCHTSTLYRLVQRGDIPAFRLGGGWRLTWDSLDRWMRKSQRGL